jgi:coenzyme F420 hydrogenase subunit beta
MSGLEAKVHGRARDINRPDELHFGPFKRMVRAALNAPHQGCAMDRHRHAAGRDLAGDAARWTWCSPSRRILRIAGSRFRSWSPGRRHRQGARHAHGLCPAPRPDRAGESERGYKRVAVIGIPCQVYALRALEDELELDKLYVIGTPCSDNTTTERFHDFLALLSDQPDTITYLEFRADYQVELRFEDGRRKEIPFLKLPISKLPPDFFPLTCRTCVDYTNVLADITVGYMGGEGEQWLLVRNETGEELVSLLGG